MPDFRNYDPATIILTWRGILIQGYFDGTFVGVERTEDTFSMAPGAQGDVTRVRSRDKTGSITFTLKAESPTNDLLSAAIALDEATGQGRGEVLLRNLNGTTVAGSAEAWLRRPANIEYGDEATGREWVLDCAFLESFAGGAVT